MKNLRILLADHPGRLAAMAETLGSAGISIEGGGMFVVDGKGIANFLVEDGPAARQALEAVGIEVIRQDDVVIQKLNQDEPGQLGKLLRKMAQANVNVVTQYSDHNHQLVLVVDDLQAAQALSDAWMQERSAPEKTGTAALPAKTRSHHYAVDILWTGNKGAGTSGYTAYERSHDISSSEKAVIGGSSDPPFRGDRTRYNPEELLVASASACHMLSYLHLCATNGVVVVSYEDRPTGEIEEVIGGPGAFVQMDSASDGDYQPRE
jgi:organic hydroperoxide reductase OsmC/OhrA